MHAASEVLAARKQSPTNHITLPNSNLVGRDSIPRSKRSRPFTGNHQRHRRATRYNYECTPSPIRNRPETNAGAASDSSHSIHRLTLSPRSPGKGEIGLNRSARPTQRCVEEERRVRGFDRKVTSTEMGMLARIGLPQRGTNDLQAGTSENADEQACETARGTERRVKSHRSDWRMLAERPQHGLASTSISARGAFL